MVYMTQQLLCELEDSGLLTDESPNIELENAGWGLEHGVQVADDYRFVFSQVYDPRNKLKIGWEINHILHALGCSEVTGDGRFFLPEAEITPDMAWLEASYGHNPQKLAMEWVAYNLLAPDLQGRIGSVHLSDCKMKTVEYFRNGILGSPFLEKMEAMETVEERFYYGWQMVLDYYDSHVPLGTGILPEQGMKEMLDNQLAFLGIKEGEF